MTDFPSWWGPEGGPPKRFFAESEVPKDFVHVPGDYNYQTGQWIDAAPSAGDIKTLRAEYHAKFGKRPFNGWSEAILREKLA